MQLMNTCSPRDNFITAQDGLRLHVREWGPRTSAAIPVVCLPGLARTTADFEALARALATHGRARPGPARPTPDFEALAQALATNGQAGRRVLALDSRGRGKSNYDSNPANYTLAMELGDLLAVLTATSIAEAGL